MTRIHLSLRTLDLAGTAGFYAELFGPPDKIGFAVGPARALEPDTSEASLREALLEPGVDYVRFMPKDVPILLSLIHGEPAVDHLGVRVDDPAALAKHAARLGATANEGVVCCNAVKDELWRMDPDGRAWELYAVTDEQPTEPKTERATACCPTPAPSTSGCC